LWHVDIESDNMMMIANNYNDQHGNDDIGYSGNNELHNTDNNW
jgi:hypothetical protein